MKLWMKILCFFDQHSPVYRHPKTGLYLHLYLSDNIGIKCDWCNKSLVV